VLHVVFTLDYEIHGNGEGCPRELMLEPTDRLLRLFDEHGAKLTIMADVAEILKFKEYAEQRGTDAWCYDAVATQLRDAVRRGHDVQLHIHSSYFNAAHDGRRWVQDWSEYDFARLNPQRLIDVVKRGKEFLEATLQPVRPDYRCIAFRAANWSVNPSTHVAQALLSNGLKIDTSVFKYGRRSGLVSFDYSDAWHEMAPWRANRDRLWDRDPQGALWEIPIYSEPRRLGAFVSFNRIYRVLQARGHRLQDHHPDSWPANGSGRRPRAPLAGRLSSITKRHAWKADFNQATGRQLIRALERAEARYGRLAPHLPFVLIGHSKLFTRLNARSLRPFLRFIGAQPARFCFGTFGELNLDQFDSIPVAASPRANQEENRGVLPPQ
jgi:hypothetical protein